MVHFFNSPHLKKFGKLIMFWSEILNNIDFKHTVHTVSKFKINILLTCTFFSIILLITLDLTVDSMFGTDLLSIKFSILYLSQQ